MTVSIMKRKVETVERNWLSIFSPFRKLKRNKLDTNPKGRMVVSREAVMLSNDKTPYSEAGKYVV